jgi:alginate O-acetyltransferase complex protein AlgI
LYRREAEPAKGLVDFACFVSLFPQLVAGPIVRYGSVAEQLRSREHTPEIFAMGVARFCLGFAKKILLADPLGAMAEPSFAAGVGSLNAVGAWMGLVAYAFQIYFDFSAYSDMAIGLGRMFGFRFGENFSAPYRAASITDFWRRWHISLSTFLRDYLYIPLGGNRRGVRRTYVNLMTVMVLGGLWHGANWTFVIWGLLHGVLLAFERAMAGRVPWAARVPQFAKVAVTFLIVLVTWVFFRADDVSTAGRYLSTMMGMGSPMATASLLVDWQRSGSGVLLLGAAALVVWGAPTSARFLASLSLPKVVLSIALFVVSVTIMLAQGYSPFLYFQF